MRKLLTYLLPLLLVSCTAISSLVHDDQVVARVGKNKLYKSELERFIPNMIPSEDSLRLADQYINTWAMDQLYLEVAEAGLRALGLRTDNACQQFDGSGLSRKNYVSPEFFVRFLAR